MTFSARVAQGSCCFWNARGLILELDWALLRSLADCYMSFSLLKQGGIPANVTWFKQRLIEAQLCLFTLKWRIHTCVVCSLMSRKECTNPSADWVAWPICAKNAHLSILPVVKHTTSVPEPSQLSRLYSSVTFLHVSHNLYRYMISQDQVARRPPLSASQPCRGG